jgi:hypothetical protein
MRSEIQEMRNIQKGSRDGEYSKDIIKIGSHIVGTRVEVDDSQHNKREVDYPHSEVVSVTAIVSIVLVVCPSEVPADYKH